MVQASFVHTKFWTGFHSQGNDNKDRQTSSISAEINSKTKQHFSEVLRDRELPASEQGEALVGWGGQGTVGPGLGLEEFDWVDSRGGRRETIGGKLQNDGRS